MTDIPRQKDTLVLYLASRRGEWVLGSALQSKELLDLWVSDRGKRTLRELASVGKHRIGTKNYYVEGKKFPAEDRFGRKRSYVYYRCTKVEETKIEGKIIGGVYKLKVPEQVSFL